MIVGRGKFQYRVNADWAKLPDGWSFKEVGGVGVDSNDNVYAFNRGEHPIFYVGEVGPAAAVSRDIPNLGPQVSIVDHQCKLIGRFGDTPAGTELGKFLAPHGLAVDTCGDVYVGEVSRTA
jgi:hypothetical protein